MREYFVEDVLQMLGPRYRWRTVTYRDTLVDGDLDLELVEETVYYVTTSHPPGAILVFLTGWDDIKTLEVRLMVSFALI